MHIVVLTDNFKFSGGRRLLLEYAEHLQQRHTVEVLAREAEGELRDGFDCRVVPRFGRQEIPPADAIVASVPEVVRDAVEADRGKVVHFCQGCRMVDLRQRLDDGVVPLRMSGRGVGPAVRRWRKRRQWRSALRELDDIYRLPTHLVTVSKHLQQQLHAAYGKCVALCTNGVRGEHFFAGSVEPTRRFTAARPCRVICVGPLEVTFKGIRETLKAVQTLKRRGLPVHFVRVSPTPFQMVEKDSRIVDEFHQGVTPQEMGQLLRQSDVYVSNSLEAEGFGLPAMEALSCGLPSILSDIPSYRGFSDRDDFCVFVPQRDPAATAAALDRLIAGPAEVRTTLRRAALEVASGYSFLRACERFERVLLDVVGGGRAAA